MKKEENFWDYCEKRIDSVKEYAVNLVDEYVSSGADPENSINANELTAMRIMEKFMNEKDSAPKEVSMFLLSPPVKGKKRLQNDCLSALSKVPSKHAWSRDMAPRTIHQLSNEEILEMDTLYALEELKKHGTSLLASQMFKPKRERRVK